MHTPSKQELKDWMQNPVTEYVIGRVKDMRRETLEQATLQMDTEMIAVIVRAVGGMDRALELIEGLCTEGEEE